MGRTNYTRVRFELYPDDPILKQLYDDGLDMRKFYGKPDEEEHRAAVLKRQTLFWERFESLKQEKAPAKNELVTAFMETHKKNFRIIGNEELAAVKTIYANKPLVFVDSCLFTYQEDIIIPENFAERVFKKLTPLYAFQLCNYDSARAELIGAGVFDKNNYVREARETVFAFLKERFEDADADADEAGFYMSLWEATQKKIFERFKPDSFDTMTIECAIRPATQRTPFLLKPFPHTIGFDGQSLFYSKPLASKVMQHKMHVWHIPETMLTNEIFVHGLVPWSGSAGLIAFDHKPEMNAQDVLVRHPKTLAEYESAALQAHAKGHHRRKKQIVAAMQKKFPDAAVPFANEEEPEDVDEPVEEEDPIAEKPVPHAEADMEEEEVEPAEDGGLHHDPWMDEGIDVCVDLSSGNVSATWVANGRSLTVPYLQLYGFFGNFKTDDALWDRLVRSNVIPLGLQMDEAGNVI